MLTCSHIQYALQVQLLKARVETCLAVSAESNQDCTLDADLPLLYSTSYMAMFVLSKAAFSYFCLAKFPSFTSPFAYMVLSSIGHMLFLVRIIFGGYSSMLSEFSSSRNTCFLDLSFLV